MMGKNVIFVIAAMCGFWSCTKTAVLEMNMQGVKSLEATVTCNGNETVSFFDDQGRMHTELELSEPGYCFVRYGNVTARYYLEPGRNLFVEENDQEVRAKEGRYRYDGELAQENRILNDTDFYSNLPLRFTPETTIHDVWDRIFEMVDNNLSLLDSVDKACRLSTDFLGLERDRIKYAGWGSYTRFNKWDPAIFGYLEPLLVDKPRLFYMKEYMDFMENGIYVLGLRNADKNDTYRQTVDQIEFIRDNMARSRVASALLEKLLIRHVEINPGGIDEIENLLALPDYDFLADSPSFETFYGEWAHLKRGSPVPDIALEYRDGKPFLLSELKGQYVFIDCWASWCSPCRAEIPALRVLEENYAGKPIAFVSISGDNYKEKWVGALDELKLEGYQVREPDRPSEFDIFFKVGAIPRFILLDRDGTILRAVMSRPSDPATGVFLDNLDM